MSAAPRIRRRTVKSTADFVIGVFTRNLPAKIAALVLAWLVWFTVRQDLTREATLRADLKILLPAGILLAQDAPGSVEVDWTGPASRIADLEGRERREIHLKIREADLASDRGTFSFSAAQGNLDHPYGEAVRIDEIRPSPVTLQVARAIRKTLPVRIPAVEDLPDSWRIRDLKILTPEVEVVGPADLVRALEEVRPEPIVVGRSLRLTGREERDEFNDLPLALSAEHIRDHIRLANGQRISYRLVLERSGEERSLSVPLVIYQVHGESLFTLEPRDTDVLKGREGRWEILLRMRGVPSDLTAVEEAIREGRLRAYVRAEDVNPDDPRVYDLEVHLEGWDEFARRVRFFQPPSRSLEFHVKRN